MYMHTAGPPECVIFDSFQVVATIRAAGYTYLYLSL